MKPTRTLATSKTPDGESLILLEHDGHHYMKVGGIPLMGTHASYSEKAMADIACANLPLKPRVLIGGLGFGYTLRRVLELCPPDATVDVAELLQVVVDWNREFLAGVNGLLIDDPRVHVHMDNSPDPLVQKGNAKLYDGGGLTRVKAALQPVGRVVYWSANPDKLFSSLLGKHFANVQVISAKAYPEAKRFTHTLFVGDRV